MNKTKQVIKKLLMLLLVVVLADITYHYFAERHYQANLTMGEEIGPDEDAAMAEAIAMALDMITMTRDGLVEKGLTGDYTLAGEDADYDEKPLKTTGGHDGPVVYRRDVHIKSHGCVKANFIVNELDSRYRWGVFSEPKTYQAWVRYSNGNYMMAADGEPDARGMAIKLMGVEGKKLLPGHQDATTQDFVMMNNKVYFIRYLADYVELTKYLAVGDDLGYFLNDKSPNPFSWRWRELRLVLGTKKRAPETPLLTQYYSASSYKLGPDNNIKFSARPKACPGVEEKSTSWQTGKKDYNFLRLRMAEQLAAGPACFDFMVQLQVPGKIMPVEDSTIVWKEKDSPFVPVATIEIPQQDFNNEDQNRFCENLSYNPWHSLPEHRPTGVFNRVRKALYQEVARYRWGSNQGQYGEQSRPTLQDGQPPEPVSWCIDGTDGECSPAGG